MWLVKYVDDKILKMNYDIFFEVFFSFIYSLVKLDHYF